MLSTENMGGVVVTPNQLTEMQAGDYILHARDSVRNTLSARIRYRLRTIGRRCIGQVIAEVCQCWSAH